MINTFLRSSSYTTHSMCPQKFYIEYVLGMRSPSSKAADKGNVVHKAMEIMAHVSMCRRNGDTKYVDETFGLVEVDQATPEWATDVAYDHYSGLSPHIAWSDAERRECQRWTKKALLFNGGQYDPRNQHVIAAEQKFDFEIDKPWARYDYTLADGTRVEGNLGMKGTIDLITQDRDNPKVIEVIDYKTGGRNDWSKEGFAKKEYRDFRHDPQLCLYHYAVRHIFPDAEHVFFTIYYINSGGPYTVCFEKKDIDYSERIIRDKFEEIKNTRVPELKVGRKCTSFCHFGTTMSEQDPSKTICQFIKDKVRDNGIDSTTEQFGRKHAYHEYGDGGGRKQQRDE